MAGELGGVRLADMQPVMSGGLNTVSDDIALTNTQLRKAINARLTDFGAVTKRGGTQRTSSTAIASGSSIQNGYTWRKDGGTQQIMVVANGTLYTTTYASFPLTYTAQTGSLSSSVPPSFAQFRDGTNDVVYISDGDLLNKWDGTTLTTNIASTALTNTIVVHNERLWGCGNTTYPDSIFYSALNNGSTLGIGASGGGQIVVRTFADETVLSLASVNTSLLIFHKRGISRLTGYGQDDITVAPQGVTADVGLIAAKSVVSIGNEAFFVSERGLYRCNESQVAPVATPETPDPLLPIIRGLTATQFSNIRAGFGRATRELWLSIPGIGVYTFHTILNAWAGPWDTGYVTPATTSIWETLDANGLPVMLKGDASGWVSLCDAPGIYTDNVSATGSSASGTRYAMTVQMHRMYCGDDALAKSLRWGYITANTKGSDQCSIRWDTDAVNGSYSLPISSYGVWGASGNTWGNGVWAAGTSRSYRVPMGGTGYYIDVSIIDSGATLPVFSRVQLETFSLGRR